jgi:CHASE1-domain containing sensor protein
MQEHFPQDARFALVNSLPMNQSIGRRRWFPLGVLLASLLLTVFATYYAAHSIHLRHRAEFDLTSQRVRSALDARMDIYIAVLQGMSGYFSAQTNVTRQQFSTYANRLDVRVNYPGIQGVGYSQRVRRGTEASVTQWMEGQGAAGFRIWPEFEGGQHTIVFLEPLDARNRVALGYNMFSDPARRAAMEKARDTGAPAASGRVTLVQEIDQKKQPGFLIYVPVYTGAPTTEADRRRQLR